MNDLKIGVISIDKRYINEITDFFHNYDIIDMNDIGPITDVIDRAYSSLQLFPINSEFQFR